MNENEDPSTDADDTTASNESRADRAIDSSGSVPADDLAEVDRRTQSTEGPDGTALADPSALEAPLFREDQTSAYRGRWDEIQARFVDDPRRAVQDADDLVRTVIGELQASFSARREVLEAGWQRGGDVSTEDLRLALQGYRSFFGRLLGA